MKDLLGREEAVKVKEALNLLMEQELKQLDTETLQIEEAYKRVYQKI